MTRPSTHLSRLLGVATLATTCACAPFTIETPAGYAVVKDHERHTRMKAGDNVGVSVNVFHNVDGGTLAYWSEDLVAKLGARGYHLRAQRAVRSANGQEGARFDFDYTAPGDDAAKFYTAVLFATDRYRVVLALAGDATHGPRHQGRVDAIASELKIRGCRLRSKICNSGQPPQLSTPPPEAPAPETPEPAPEGDSAEPPVDPATAVEPATSAGPAPAVVAGR